MKSRKHKLVVELTFNEPITGRDARLAFERVWEHYVLDERDWRNLYADPLRVPYFGNSSMNVQKFTVKGFQRVMAKLGA